MAQQVQLALVIHNHQPVGNFDHVFEEVCARAYLPFLRTLLDFPAVRIGLHTSGPLLEWVEAHRPEYGQLVDELLARGQVEILGGGMYEPILPVLPERDALRQLKRMSSYLELRFGARPRGAWIPERVWEPQLPAVLAAAGYGYCLLDDYHFEGNANSDTIATDYFITDHAGSSVALLPISKQLRYTIPFKPPQDTLDYLRSLADKAEQVPLAVFGDDGEKFGIWPDTYDWVHEKGWLREFFQALTDNRDWIDIRLPGEVVAQRAPADTVYIPSRSYFEMGEWTRVDGDAAAQPGHWRNFFCKYPESRQLHQRVLEVSAALHKLGLDAPDHAWDDLGRAQCNCCYWHGVFGGIYLNYLRQAVTHNLLKAEQAVVGAKHAPPQLRDRAQKGEACFAPTNRLRNDSLSLTLHPEHGLAISRIDYYPTLFNWGDVLARRREVYHSKLLEIEHRAAEHQEQASIHEIVRVKEQGLERMLVEDPHPRHSFVTYFSRAESPEEFLYANSGESTAMYRDWNVSAELVTVDTGSISAVVQSAEFTLRKSVVLSGISARLKAEVKSVPTDHGDYFVEFNLTALTDQADDRYLLIDGQRYALNQGQALPAASQIALVDGWQQRRLVLVTAAPARLIAYPVHTVSSSEGGFERTYQGTCIMLGFNPHGLKRVEIVLRVEEL